VKAREFAEMAGVTVRTLHHYDRLGLLRPGRNGSGYRMYRERDLERLEQIVALKFLGLPLAEIRKLLDHGGRDLATTLRMQREVLEERRRLLDRAIRAIREAEQTPRPALLRKIIEVIGMQENTDWKAKYYSPEAQAKIESRAGDWTQANEQWQELFREVEAHLNEDPAGPKAQELAARWRALAGQFTMGDPEITAGLRKLWADQANWPAEFKEQAKDFTKKEVWEFIGKALGCGK
jgi:DNA-binding transcriptional MerR regulator